MAIRNEGAKLIEFLHLAFLQVLPVHVREAEYVVKGGANLRLFYNSRRRSQDIDFDFAGTAFWRLGEHVDGVLASRAFLDLLRVRRIGVVDVSKPKQTDTTRRWKFTVKGAGAQLNSKIEFSARRADPEYALATARGDIGREAGLRAVRANHYLPPAAIRQKIRALAGRKQTEPRDLFDLDLLVSQHPGAIAKGDVPTSLVTRAANAAFDIPFEAYRELVVDFLEDEFVAVYDRRAAWEEMVTRVAEFLEGLQ
jgi:hypothetical protein